MVNEKHLMNVSEYLNVPAGQFYFMINNGNHKEKKNPCNFIEAESKVESWKLLVATFVPAWMWVLLHIICSLVVWKQG